MNTFMVFKRFSNITCFKIKITNNNGNVVIYDIINLLVISKNSFYF